MLMVIDRLSALPEPLLVDILHRLCYTVEPNDNISFCLKEAARTSVLSKQWRFLWTNIPPTFRNWSRDYGEIRSFVASVSALLAARRAPLDSLLVRFRFNKRFAADVDFWLDSAAKGGVESLTLQHFDHNYDYEDDDGPPYKYVLPRIIYSLSSLSLLDLHNCLVQAAAVEWGRLKTLRIDSAEISQEVVEAIVSGSPLLQSLSLLRCGGFDRLEIKGRSFRNLTVESYRCSLTAELYGDGEAVLEISAPYARYLGLKVSCDTILGGKVRVRVRDAPSVESADIDLDYYKSEAAAGVAIELFEELRHVKSLHLYEYLTKVLSTMATRGLRLPQLKAERLCIRVPTYLKSIRGVVAMLESCPYLEEFFISGWEAEESFINGWKADEDSSEPNPTVLIDLDRDLSHLKNVRIQILSYRGLRSETSLTLAQILLKRTPILEKMVIVLTTYFEKLFEKYEALLTCPRSSRKAVVEFTNTYADT